MEYSKIIAVTGLPGLYELLNSKSDGAIVRSLDDKSTRFVSSRVHNFSHLESIEVFTHKENVNLSVILEAMEKSPEKLPDEKDEGLLKKYFGKVYADLDFDRVYSSDLKKMVKWFSLLKSNQIDFKVKPEEEEAAAGSRTESAPEEQSPEEPKKTKKKAKPETPEPVAPAKKTGARKAGGKDAGKEAEPAKEKKKTPAKAKDKSTDKKPKKK